MVSEGELIDIIFDCLKNKSDSVPDFRAWINQSETRQGKWGTLVSKPYNQGTTSLPARRIFLSEFEIKKLLKKNPKELHVPKQTILSPLAEDWLKEKRVPIFYE